MNKQNPNMILSRPTGIFLKCSTVNFTAKLNFIKNGNNNAKVVVYFLKKCKYATHSFVMSFNSLPKITLSLWHASVKDRRFKQRQ